MNKILYLGVTQFIEEHKLYLNVNSIYRKIPKFLNPIRFLFFYFDLPCKKIWLNKDFFTSISSNDIVILSASQYNLKISKIIEDFVTKENIINKRFIYWYWNPVDRVGLISNPSNFWELWSFDLEDCKKYDLIYNNTYYFKELVIKKAISIDYDFAFIGLDKNRYKQILALVNKIADHSKNNFIRIVKDNTTPKNVSQYIGTRMAYQEILDILSKSKIIIDITQANQTGLTLRVMESIFFGKKIITNNKNIKNYNFYNTNNIFILGNDKDLSKFIKNEFIPYTNDIIKNYTIENWINKIIKYESN